MTLLAATGARVFDDARTAVATIADDDDPPALRIAGARVAEGGTASVVLTLAEPSGRPLTVDWSTADGSAVAGNDYTAVASETVTFAPGTESVSLRVETVDDATREPEETFTVRAARRAEAGEAAPEPVEATVAIAADEDMEIGYAGSASAPSAPVRTIWSATMTVGAETGGAARGFWSAEGVGGLSDGGFTYRGTPYSIAAIADDGRVALDTAIPAGDRPGLIFRLGGLHVELDRAGVSATGGGEFLVTFDDGLVSGQGWQAGDAVPVALLELATPSQPTGLIAEVTGARSVRLSWTAPRVHGGGVAAYRVEHSDDGGASWRVRAPRTAGAATTWRDEGLAPSQTRSWRVRALGANGRAGAASNAVSATTLAGVLDIAVTSAPAQGGGTYLAGEAVEITATFPGPAELFGASMALALGGDTVTAACVETGGRCLASPSVVFRHVVRATDRDEDGEGAETFRVRAARRAYAGETAPPAVEATGGAGAKHSVGLKFGVTW